MRPSLGENVDEARNDLVRLKQFGIDLDQVTRELEVEGVEAFVKSYDGLLEAITAATRKIELAPSGPVALHQRSTST